MTVEGGNGGEAGMSVGATGMSVGMLTAGMAAASGLVMGWGGG